jgi:hypothetical protein
MQSQQNIWSFGPIGSKLDFDNKPIMLWRKCQSINNSTKSLAYFLDIKYTIFFLKREKLKDKPQLSQLVQLYYK